jgi:hypothetical protein
MYVLIAGVYVVSSTGSVGVETVCLLSVAVK